MGTPVIKYLPENEYIDPVEQVYEEEEDMLIMYLMIGYIFYNFYLKNIA